MGIQGLLPLLKSIMVPIHIKELEGCSVAVDTYSWLHKGALSCSRELCKGLPTTRRSNKEPRRRISEREQSAKRRRRRRNQVTDRSMGSGTQSETKAKTVLDSGERARLEDTIRRLSDEIVEEAKLAKSFSDHRRLTELGFITEKIVARYREERELNKILNAQENPVEQVQVDIEMQRREAEDQELEELIAQYERDYEKEQRQRVKEFEMQSRSRENESKLLPLKKRGRGLDFGASSSETFNGKPQTEPEEKENKPSGLRANKVGRTLDHKEPDADIRRDVVIRSRSHETDSGPLQQHRSQSDGSPMQRKLIQSNVYPVRHGEEDCEFYLRTGQCDFGRKCKFNHPTHLPQVETIPEVPEENKEKEEDSLPAEVLNIPVSMLNDMLAVQSRGVIELIKVTNRVLKKDVAHGSGTTTSCTYTRLRDHIPIPEETAIVDWRPYFGPVKDQGDHDICWAIVAVELVTALRRIEGRESSIVEYSYQELVDFVKPKKGLDHPKFPKHCCYTLNIRGGLTYGMLKGHQKAVDRPWEGCRLSPPPRLLSHAHLGYTGKPKRMDTIEEALVQLQKQPIGASMPIFVPDYQRIKGGIYRGPTFAKSRFAGMHAVSISGAGTKRGESFAYVRTSHGRGIGRDGYLRVSIDVLILRINKGQEHERKYFRKPTRLLTRFCCPQLLTESEENEMKKRMEKEIEKSD